MWRTGGEYTCRAIFRKAPLCHLRPLCRVHSSPMPSTIGRSALCNAGRFFSAASSWYSTASIPSAWDSSCRSSPRTSACRCRRSVQCCQRRCSGLMVAAMASGPIADRYGRRWVVIVSVIVRAVRAAHGARDDGERAAAVSISDRSRPRRCDAERRRAHVEITRRDGCSRSSSARSSSVCRPAR